MVRYESNGRLAVAEPVQVGFQVPKAFMSVLEFEDSMSLW